MPFTFLAHQAPVAPLKLWRPRWFSGTALVLGSMAPDFEKFIRGNSYGGRYGHTLAGQFLFCLPAALLVYVLLRHLVAPPLARLLRDGRALRIRDYFRAVADGPAPGWVKLVTSILVGSCSHVVLDGFTHADPRVVALFPALGDGTIVIAGRPVWSFFVYQLAATAIGALVTLVVMRHLARRRTVLEWAGLPPEAGDAMALPPAAARAYRRTVVAVTLLGLALAVALAPVSHRRGGWGRRAVFSAALRSPLVVFAALCAGGLVVRRSARRPALGSIPDQFPTRERASS